MLIGYARVSTQDQNPEMQIESLESAGCEKIFEETASGAQRDRPELLKALEYAREGDTIVVWKYDRLGRSLRQLINTVEGLEARGIGFQSLTESIDTQTPGGKLIFHVFASLAEFERGVIRERTMAGLANAREKGRKGGRPRAMTEEDVQMAKTLLADPKVNVVDIAKKLGIGLTTLYRAFPGGRSALAKQSHEQ